MNLFDIPQIAAPVAIAKAVVPGDDYDPNPQYSYSYDINVCVFLAFR